MKRKYQSIKLKLIRIVLITNCVVLLLTCSAFFAYEFFTFRQTTKDQLFTLGKIVAANSTAALAFQSHDDANEILQALRGETHITAACLYDEDGNLFAKYPLALSESKIPGNPGPDGYNYKEAHLEGFQPVIQQEIRLGTLYLQSDLKAITERFKLYALVTSLVILMAIGVAYLLSRRLQKELSDPILALAKTAGTVSNKQDYTVRAQKFDNDEIGELTEAFNHMLTQIEQQNAEITSFNRDLEIKVNERTRQLELANAELKQKNQFVETIIDSSIDLIAVFDTELNYVILNKYARDVYKVELQDVMGRNILDVFPAVKDSQMYADLNKCLLGNLIHNPYYKSHISDKILENFYIPLLDKDNKLYNILVIGHDITQIVDATNKLSSLNNELAKSNRDLEQFAYVASHDLQEPLRKIHTYATFLEKKIGDKEASLNYLAKIVASVVRMRELITSILNYSQTSTTRGNFERVDLNEIIESLTCDYELLIDETGAEIKTDELPVIEGNKLQLSQLFHNLISNSLKFSQKKPEINISSSVVAEDDFHIAAFPREHGNYHKIIFRDNGIGFDQHFAEKIFTIFQRFHSRNEYPGTGIGLALCKKIVENHSGHIIVKSKPAEGTTFEIYLPINSQSN